MTENVILGIDTSNYTTSIALICEDGELLANIKRPLPVKLGERGLRQSEALFSHIKNLPSAFEEVQTLLCGHKICAVGVSEKPRNLQNSYMPCFLAGVNAALAVGCGAGAPIFKFSHQCGHIMAAIYSSENFELLEKPFAGFHVSGGTTELLGINAVDNGFVAEHLGGSRDLNAGQVIDRIGVSLGLMFPAGKELEALALEYQGKIPKKKISRDGTWINLSGLENMAMRLYSQTLDKNLTAAFVFDYIGNAIVEMSDAYIEKYGNTDFVYAGGVMCNSIIRKKLSDRFKCSFAVPSMSSDNAVGIAYLALRSYNNLRR